MSFILCATMFNSDEQRQGSLWSLLGAYCMNVRVCACDRAAVSKGSNSVLCSNPNVGVSVNYCLYVMQKSFISFLIS